MTYDAKFHCVALLILEADALMTHIPHLRFTLHPLALFLLRRL